MRGTYFEQNIDNFLCNNVPVDILLDILLRDPVVINADR